LISISKEKKKSKIAEKEQNYFFNLHLETRYTRQFVESISQSQNVRQRRNEIKGKKREDIKVLRLRTYMKCHDEEVGQT